MGRPGPIRLNSTRLGPGPGLRGLRAGAGRRRVRGAGDGLARRTRRGGHGAGADPTKARPALPTLLDSPAGRFSCSCLKYAL
ncbi:cx9C motif-containing protein 4 isoform X2 [Molothrus ater]|uniref:cx9C motif-containing protein 4 isoform X2 n=1 Tax=Molothrus ater TaxID=84834 RepID=UPI0023E8D725|nr:cx9C motif-containing protein 4 isoform X2 [Molothrus ater]